MSAERIPPITPKKLESDCNEIINYLKMHKLKVNVSKTEYVIFTKKNNNNNQNTITINSQLITNGNSAKYLGIHIDSSLKFEKQVNVILQKMAAGIKTIYSIRDSLPLRNRLILVKSIVLSHLSYSSPILTSLTQAQLNSINKQISWALKACYNSLQPSATKLKKKHDILPANLFMEQSNILYFHRIFAHSSSFKNINMPTSYRTSSRGVMSLNNTRIKTNFLKNSIIKRGCDIFNQLPESIKSDKLCTSKNCKFKKGVKLFFSEKLQTLP